jgi:hypothetical protein
MEYSDLADMNEVLSTAIVREETEEAFSAPLQRHRPVMWLKSPSWKQPRVWVATSWAQRIDVGSCWTPSRN